MTRVAADGSRSRSYSPLDPLDIPTHRDGALSGRRELSRRRSRSLDAVRGELDDDQHDPSPGSADLDHDDDRAAVRPADDPRARPLRAPRAPPRQHSRVGLAGDPNAEPPPARVPLSGGDGRGRTVARVGRGSFPTRARRPNAPCHRMRIEGSRRSGQSGVVSRLGSLAAFAEILVGEERRRRGPRSRYSRPDGRSDRRRVAPIRRSRRGLGSLDVQGLKPTPSTTENDEDGADRLRETRQI